MFGKLKQFFSGESTLDESVKASLLYDKTGQLTDHDMHVAAAVLLVQIASSDQQIAKEEAEAVCALIENNFNIPSESIPNLIETAVAARREKVKIDEFVDLINARFNPGQKQTLLAMIWKVVLADNKVERFEDRLVTQLKTRLKLSDEQNDEARKMAEEDKV